jgi:hypothetical protein
MVGVTGVAVLVGVGRGVGVSVGRAMAVRVKSTATVSAMLVITSSGLIVGVAELHAESSKTILKPSNRRLPIVFLFFIITPRRTK